MVNTRIIDYTETHTPEQALASNTPGGIKDIRKEILADIAMLRSAKESFDILGMKEEARWCFDKAVNMAKWLIKLGASNN